MLIEETKKYQMETERDATELLEKFKIEQDAKDYILIKSSCTRKEVKSKGEIVDTYYIVSVTMKY